ncbi:MAG TPA: metalloprotease, partial [Desulfobacterales bacterium]|nr:metalloprotease [Desulfobacterales bacterium]
MPTPFFDEEFTFTNPDGSTIQVRGWGNQHYAVFETLDGYTVVKDPETGFYKYATLSEDKNDLVPTDVTVGEADP